MAEYAFNDYMFDISAGVGGASLCIGVSINLDKQFNKGNPR